MGVLPVKNHYTELDIVNTCTLPLATTTTEEKEKQKFLSQTSTHVKLLDIHNHILLRGCYKSIANIILKHFVQK